LEDLFEQRIWELNAPVRNRLGCLFDGRGEPFEVYGLLSEFLSEKGKLLRPALCLSSCGAVGGRVEDAAPAASAIEMFHNFTLIHDDIEDCSAMRRGRPCLHVKYGVPLALNAGDGLFMMVWRETLRLSGERREAVQERLLGAFTRVLEGQARELGWYQKDRWDVGIDEYFQVIGGKTGALISVSCEAGAMVGGAHENTCAELAAFGQEIGVGFQIIDDALNIGGDEKKYGKEIGGDIREGKRTLLTIYALENLQVGKGRALRAILKKKNKSHGDVHSAVRLIKEAGAVEHAAKTADGIVGRALGRLDALPEGEHKKTLAGLAKYITRRER